MRTFGNNSQARFYSSILFVSMLFATCSSVFAHGKDVPQKNSGANQESIASYLSPDELTSVLEGKDSYVLLGPVGVLFFNDIPTGRKA